MGTALQLTGASFASVDHRVQRRENEGIHQRGAYVNFLDRDDQDRVRAAYGIDKYDAW